MNNMNKLRSSFCNLNYYNTYTGIFITRYKMKCKKTESNSKRDRDFFMILLEND